MELFIGLGMPVLIIAAIMFFCLPLQAQPVRDVVVFDEDDPLGRDYYDASIGHATGGSMLRLLATSGDKMPVRMEGAARGKVSGVIEWTSREGGSWEMHIFRPGFPMINLAAHETIRVEVNGPRGIRAEDLPRIELHDVRGRIAWSEMGRYGRSGVDEKIETWQRIEIPISTLSEERDFDRAQVKHITLRQGRADENAHVLWIDDLRVLGKERAVATVAPRGPSGIMGRAGDKSVTLHWEWARDADADQVDRYRVYRREANGGEFIELTQSPVTVASIADVQVENGKTYTYVVRAENEAGLGAPSEELRLAPRAFRSDDEFLEYVQGAAFDFFWFEANPKNGMIRDRTQPWSAASIAAMGFGLTAIGIGVDHGWIGRKEGAERVRRTLQALWTTPQGAAASGTSGHKGWFYHFLNFEDGTRFGTSELSSIDTALLLGGVLYAAEYFDGDNDTEAEIRRLAGQIYERVDWKWMLNGGETLTMGWYPERGFITARWEGYNEASILYLLGIGAEGANALGAEHWVNWTKSYSWRTSHGYTFIHFPPLFGHQYSGCWIDFRGMVDDYTASKGITYFENSRRATLAQREYCIANPGKFIGYGPEIWGLTACDGPGSNGAHGYIARGAPPAENDDGTIAPTAAGGSLPYAPEECVRALRSMYDQYREQIWCGYGFRDAFNLKENWWGEDVIGIDQGAILMMAENLRTGGVWERMKKCQALERGLKRAGFRSIGNETRQ